MRRFVLIPVLLFILHLSAFAQLEIYNHPELKWQTFETEHFVIHFHQGTKRSALLIAKIAEDIHPHLTKLYNYEPNGKIHFIIKDTDDYSNGGAFFFDDKVEIWANNLDYIMRGTQNWLRNVVTHEYSHMISIQKMIKTNLLFPYGFFQVFAYEKERRKDVVRGFPNGLVSYPISSINIPVWFAEGVAQHQAPGAHYDYRDPHREMILRDRIINNQLLTFNSMSVFGKGSNGNESSYNLGYSFVNYLTNRFGEEILERITVQSAKWNSYTFNGVLEKATGVNSDQLYKDWKDSLTTVYTNRLETIEANTVMGEPVELEGTANIYPAWSPDGNKIAWISNKGEDYFSYNRIVVLDKTTGKRTDLTSMITSSLSWSPDGRYLAYARQEHDKTGSSYNDLYVYDFKDEKEIRLSKGLRGTNPDFSNDGKMLCFVSAANGLHQLNLFQLPENFKGEFDKTLYFDKETGELIKDKNNAQHELREVQLLGGSVVQVLAFQDNRQIYHPRWSNDDKKIIFDTSVEYGRNLGEYDLTSKKFSLFLKAEEELRYPVFQKNTPYLYYAASSTGIYNIYRGDLKTGATELLTNVTGGAMMPSVNEKGELAYACYDSVGYKIYEIDNPEPVNPKLSVYNPNYIASIPDKNFDDTKLDDPEVKPYKQTFTPIHILPRLLIDYGTIKPGFYLISSDVLDKYTLLGGAASNTDFDYDLYGLFEVRQFKPTLYLEAYNMSANIKDNLEIPDGRESILYKRDINFDLTEFRLGLTGKLFNLFDFRGAYALRNYNAKIDQAAGVKNGQVVDASFSFHYNYLKGSAIEASIFADLVHPNRNSEINPEAGRYFFLRYSYEMSDLIEDFAITTIGIDEIYTKYRYNQIEMDWEEFFNNPFLENHAFSIRLRGGYIDRKVDSFFDFFAGGLIGMKGYSFYSIEGRQKLITTLTYRFPLWQNIDSKFGHFYFDKLYLGLFSDYGNAWNPNNFDLKDFKRDIGIQLRLDSFSYNLFPTRFFAEAVYPLDHAKNFDDSREKLIDYPREWRFYFGALFEFDLRERVTRLMDGNRWFRHFSF
jgi:Tol biopolymer transport system component